MTVKELFDKHDDEHLKFERIPDHERPYKQPDLCAFVYLAGKLPCVGDVVSDASHDEIYLGFEELERLTEEDVLYIVRCGVMYDEDNDCLWMFT